MAAARNGHLDVVALLLKNDANIHHIDNVSKYVWIYAGVPYIFTLPKLIMYSQMTYVVIRNLTPELRNSIFKHHI